MNFFNLFLPPADRTCSRCFALWLISAATHATSSSQRWIAVIRFIELTGLCLCDGVK